MYKIYHATAKGLQRVLLTQHLNTMESMTKTSQKIKKILLERIRDHYDREKARQWGTTTIWFYSSMKSEKNLVEVEHAYKRSWREERGGERVLMVTKL